MLLADEINRAPPKTQSALLEAMQERSVTFAGQTHKLPQPFFVLATQNPIEQAWHLSSAGSAAGPLPAAHRCRLPDRRRGNGDGLAHHPRFGLQDAV
ncbi:AAA family ATPase [Massilia sp. H-1]|nr:AAA family ATPase [Massilia sp. H-1]